MVLLQHKLNVKLSQRQILTPGMVQMVSVLALNKLELKDMITAEMVENPVLEELEDAVPMLDEVGRQEEERERLAAKATTEENPITATEKKDPFEEIDFGSFFQEYLDPGYRSSGEMEEIEKPSFENFLSKPGNLTDHLRWQLGAISVRPPVREAAEEIIGNLNEDGYLIASAEELLGVVPAAPPEADAKTAAKIVGQAELLGISALAPDESTVSPVAPDEFVPSGADANEPAAINAELRHTSTNDFWRMSPESGALAEPVAETAFQKEASVSAYAIPQPAFDNPPAPPATNGSSTPPPEGAVASVASPSASPSSNGASAHGAAPARMAVSFTLADLHEALEVVRQFDPPGVACRDLRECLLRQLRYHMHQLQQGRNGEAGATEQVLNDAVAVVDQHLHAITLKQFKEIARAIGRPVEAVQAALEYIRTLDPRPGLQYNKTPARLIEPDVAFVKHGDEWLIIMNDDDMPQLRLNPAYKRLLTREGNDKDTRNYVKDRYKSAIQLIKNIEQRKQ
ncbi:MAG: hypothetical protein ACRD3Q_01945, partial [Terriglobales bacterium]